MTKGQKIVIAAGATMALALAFGLGFVLPEYRARKQAEADAAAAQIAQAEADAASRRAAVEEAARLAEEQAAQQQADAEAQTAAQSMRDAVQIGDKMGRIWIEDTKVDCDLYWGDTGSIFAKGAGAHDLDGCVKPGENGTVFVGAHTGTYFADLKSVKIGDVIHIETDWGEYSYQVTDMQKIEETDVDKVRWGATQPSCVLYTCYPFGILTHTIYRWIIYGDPISETSTALPSAMPEYSASPKK